MKWNLATESPKESGLYLVIKKDGTGEYRKEVDSMYYSLQYDAWNAFDGFGAKNAIPDIRKRDELKSEFAGYIYAWAKYEIDPEEMDALEKGVE